MILYLRVVPGFGVALEELRRPDLRSAPLILGGSSRQRGTVHEANLLAQRFGVRPGMTLTQARHHCPDAVFLQPDLPYYESKWVSLCESFRSFTPLVEPIERGEMVCDLTGCEQLWGGIEQAARRMAGCVREEIDILPWVGLATNRLVAQIASMQEGLTRVAPGREKAFLADFPLSVLPEIDARLALTFQTLGLKTIDQLAALPRDAVRQRFGKLGVRLHEWANGRDTRPVVPPPENPCVTSSHALDEGTIDEAMQVLRVLAERCAEELQSRRVAGSLVEIVLRDAETRTAPRLAPDTPPPELSSRPATTTVKREGGDGAVLPVPYRVHSHLPQPGAVPAINAPTIPSSGTTPTLPDAIPHPFVIRSDAAGTTVRIPIDSADRLVAVAERLLVKIWQQHRSPVALELRVSEFPAPTQQALFDMRPDHRAIIAEGEHVLAARYGDTSFRHVAQIDPDHVLAERRFRWYMGLRR